jgi:YfiH family protein
MTNPPWLMPDWDAPSGVGAVMTTRQGGCSLAPYDSFNLGDHVGDDPQAVRQNREAFAEAIGARPVFLEQVHGTRVVRLGSGDADRAVPLQADAAVTTEPGIACTVMVADCLPVLLAAPDGKGVAAAHAGWRGLLNGVIEMAARELCEASACQAREVVGWLGASIGPRRFEVGDEVRDAFAQASPQASGRFVPGPVRGKWLADLPGLASDRLRALGISRVGAINACTVEDASRFFSFRRDGRTGRMAAAVWLRGA